MLGGLDGFKDGNLLTVGVRLGTDETEGATLRLGGEDGRRDGTSVGLFVPALV